MSGTVSDDTAARRVNTPVGPDMYEKAMTLISRLHPEQKPLLGAGKCIFHVGGAYGYECYKDGTLFEMARQMRDGSIDHGQVYIHYSGGDQIDERSYYRVGPIFDKEDFDETNKLTLCGSSSDTDVYAHEPEPFGAAGAHSSTAGAQPSAVGGVETTQKPAKIPKPRNSWILYRQAHHAEFKRNFPAKNVSEISKLISKQWKEEDAAKKNYYTALAHQEKLDHQLKYPNYKCAPRKSADIKRRKRSSPLKITLDGTTGKATFENATIDPFSLQAFQDLAEEGKIIAGTSVELQNCVKYTPGFDFSVRSFKEHMKSRTPPYDASQSSLKPYADILDKGIDFSDFENSFVTAPQPGVGYGFVPMFYDQSQNVMLSNQRNIAMFKAGIRN